MSTTITWKILNIEAITSHNSLTNVVKNVYWQVEGFGTGGQYGAHYGNQQLDVDNIDPSTYVSWDSLSSDQVVGWVKHALDSGSSGTVATIEQDVVRIVEAEERPNRKTGLPWE